MSRPDMTEAEKAESQLRDFVQAVQRYDVRTSDFIAYLMRNLKPGAIAGLARDWDDSQADAPRPWIIKSNELGTADYWSNSDGWTHYINTADRFTDAEKQTLTLPAGGEWVRMEGLSR